MVVLLWLLFLLILLVALPSPAKTDSRKAKFNFCLITIGTLRPDRLSCYRKNHIITPNIDKLAGRGVLFTKAFAHTPTTLPSHTNIFLGTTPLHHGVQHRLIYFESLCPFHTRGWAPLRGFIQNNKKYINSPIPEFYYLEIDFDELETLLPCQEKLMEAMRAYDGGRLEESRKLLKEIIAERKDLSQAYSYLATVYKEQRKLKEALEILKEGLENNPSSYKIMETYGIVLTEVGESDKAVEILKNALNYIDYDPEIWNYLGVAYWKKGDFEHAHDAFTKAVSLDGNYPIAYHNLGALYLSQYIKSKNDKNFWNAILNFKKALELDPNYAEAYNGLGTAYRQAGQMEAAIHCWERAVELNPDYGFPLYNLGLAYMMQGDKDKALTCLYEYKRGNYGHLSAKEKAKLDDLIEKVKKFTENHTG